MPIADYKCALVTGASSGIGEAVVHALAGAGLDVYAAARRGERLAALAQLTGCTAVPMDVRDNNVLYDLCERQAFDIVVNNAGLGRGRDLLVAERDDIDATIDTNVRAALHVLRASLPGMVERKRGHIVNIGSVAGLYPISSVVYGASKGAMHLLSQNLRLETRGSGVRVTEICPGRVDTEFFDVAIDDEAELERTKNAGIVALSPTDIVDAIVYALETPRHVNISTIEIQPLDQVFGGLTMAPTENGPPE